MKQKSIIFIALSILLTGCLQYQSPERSEWNKYLYGASFMDMSESAKTAKLPVYMGNGGKIITQSGELSGLMARNKKSV